MIVDNPEVAQSKGWLSPLIHLSHNWMSRAGVIIVTAATVFWLFALPTTLRGDVHNPYIGLLTYLLLPAVFFAGLILIPLGIIWRQRRERRSGLYPTYFPPLNWRNADLRRLVIFVAVTTVANIAIASQLTYGAITYMETTTFCGQTCHTVMTPEYTAYQGSPHSRVECVQCHIGPGASWFVKSKLSGLGQVVAVALNNYPRPIPTPVHNLRPARETCEQCHWPQKYAEDRLRLIDKYGDDEANSLTKTVLLLKVGGGNGGLGIHGTHLGSGVKIRYASTDEGRQNIPWIEYIKDGKSTLYLAPGAKADPGKLALREMDCMDCHNRPTHTYELPERAVDHAMEAGDISPTLPYAKKKGVEVIKQAYASREEAARRIPAEFEAYYRQSYPAVYQQRQADIRRSAAKLLAIYDRNVFPAMKVTWGSYPNNLGHTDFPGCFRCHDDAHATANGAKKVTQDCGACHNLLAMEEANPKVLTDLGVTQSKPPEQK